MPHKPNLLIVGDYNRRDFVDLFKACRNDFNFYFLEYASANEIRDPYYQQYGQAIFWGDYKDAYTLLGNIAPLKVIFFFIETYNHVALNVACKETGVTTCLLDHGIRDICINRAYEATGKKAKRHLSLACPKIPFLVRLKTRLFFSRTAKKAQPIHSSFLKHFFSIRHKSSYFETSQAIQDPLRKADIYLCFSAGTYQAHQKLDALPADQRVYYLGIPYFDELAQVQYVTGSRNQILFIDQAFVRQQLLGWTVPNKRTFAKELVDICKQNGFDLLVKAHPLEDPVMWQEVAGDAIKLIDSTNFHEAVSTSNVVVGFYSTLLLGLAALPHTTVLTYEGHPAGDFALASFITQEKVGKNFNKIEELHFLLHHIYGLHQQQKAHKQLFVEKWLYKFDGKSGDRLRALLLRPL